MALGTVKILLAGYLLYTRFPYSFRFLVLGNSTSLPQGSLYGSNVLIPDCIISNLIRLSFHEDIFYFLHLYSSFVVMMQKAYDKL